MGGMADECENIAIDELSKRSHRDDPEFFAKAARGRKVDAVVQFVKADLIKQALAVLDSLSNEEWLTLVHKSGVDSKETPSEEARAMIRERIRKW
jgi:hypothetical protein